LDGREVMDHLDLSPGPVIGEAMNMLLEHRLDDGPFSKEDAYAMLDDWWAARA
ncbi:hypothetical protein MNBD_ACTINO02-1954, partial [hydrothermal vent metagenome]